MVNLPDLYPLPFSTDCLDVIVDVIVIVVVIAIVDVIVRQLGWYDMCDGRQVLLVLFIVDEVAIALVASYVAQTMYYEDVSVVQATPADLGVDKMLVTHVPVGLLLQLLLLLLLPNSIVLSIPIVMPMLVFVHDAFAGFIIPVMGVEVEPVRVIAVNLSANFTTAIAHVSLRLKH